MKRLLALVLALLLALTLFGCWKKPEPSPAPTAGPTPDPGRGETVTTATPAPEPTDGPMATPEPMETFQPAPENTAQPTPEPLPEETEEPEEPVIVNPNQLASGSFRSDTGTALNLVADWRAAAIDATTARITVTLSLESYSLDIGERRGNILTFNGEDYYFVTDPIEIAGGDFVKTQIYVWSQEIPMSELSFDLSVRWNLRGSYSKKEMEAIELSGSYVYDGSVG